VKAYVEEEQDATKSGKRQRKKREERRAQETTMLVGADTTGPPMRETEVPLNSGVRDSHVSPAKNSLPLTMASGR